MMRWSLPLVSLVVACGAPDPLPLGPTPAPDDAGAVSDLGGPLDLGSPEPDAGSAPDLGGLGPCERRAETGNCTAAFRRFTFDPALGRCVLFLWGGCGDNPNIYETLAACEGSCGSSSSVCGGFAGARCADDEVCDFPNDDCGGADGQGQCVDRPLGCPDVFDPVCGCDGQTYSNLCDAHAAGVDAASSGPCPTDTCADQSRETLLEEARLEQVLCSGDACIERLVVSASDASTPAPCDGVQLELRGRDRGPPRQINTGALTPAGHAAVRGRARDLVGEELQSMYGCPGCDDGPVQTIRLRREGAAQTIAYEAGRPPPPLVRIDELQSELWGALRTCTSNAWVQIAPGCAPFPR